MIYVSKTIGQSAYDRNLYLEDVPFYAFSTKYGIDNNAHVQHGSVLSYDKLRIGQNALTIDSTYCDVMRAPLRSLLVDYLSDCSMSRGLYGVPIRHHVAYDLEGALPDIDVPTHTHLVLPKDDLDQEIESSIHQTSLLEA